MLQYLISKVKWRKIRKEWFRRNAHNHCAIQAPFDFSKVSIGRESYGMINPHFCNNPNEKLIIGSYCSIGENTHFIFSEHDYTRFSTFPFQNYVLLEKENNPTKGPIVLEDDVWIGMGCMILSGVTIHRGAVVGAGSVVTKDIPPYAIYAGGRILKYRFSQEYIEKLLKVDFGKLDKQTIEKNRDLLYQSMDDMFFESQLYREITE